MDSTESRFKLRRLIPDERKVKVASEYLHKLGFGADGKLLVQTVEEFSNSIWNVTFTDQARTSTSEEIAKLLDLFGSFPLPNDNPAEHELVQFDRAISAIGRGVLLQKFIDGLLINLHTNTLNKKKTKATMRDIQQHLLEMCDKGEPYTNIRDLQKRTGCGSTSTVSRAIKDSTILQEWQNSCSNRKHNPKISSLNQVHLDNSKQTCEMDPALAVEEKEIDDVFARLIQESNSDDRAKLNGMDRDQRRELVELIQKDPDRFDRILGRKP
ncbi:MAG: hypothetical protein IH984_14810 [Planctomycetes bacterium]|nr:hypothetical protein [Planctomycetota bacterium]